MGRSRSKKRNKALIAIGTPDGTLRGTMTAARCLPAGAPASDASTPEEPPPPVSRSRLRATASDREPDRLPKLCGSDVELGNFILGTGCVGTTAYDASRALLREVAGHPRARRGSGSNWEPSGYAPGDVGPAGYADGGGSRWRESGHDGGSSHGSSYGHLYDSADRGAFGSGYGGAYGSGYGGAYGSGYGGANGSGHGAWNAQDWGRRFLSENGGCIYIDLDHLELCTPEVISAFDYVAVWNAMLRIARRAMIAAQEKLPDGQKLQVLVTNSDGESSSWGSHLNFLITRRAWQNIFERKLHQLLWLASYQVSSVILTGLGKVGSENGKPAVDFQISQRADFMEEIGPSVQTTAHRPLCNSRDESLAGCHSHGTVTDAGTASQMARLHVIFYDSNLQQFATLLKMGVMQIVVAMVEAGRIDPSLILDDPLEALLVWSHDPNLESRALTARGKRVTALEMQCRFLETAARFHAEGGCDGIVPHAGEILQMWEETLLRLERRDWDWLARRLDWVLKRALLERVISTRPHLGWRSPEIKHLDHLYSSLSTSEGLYWSCEAEGLVETVVSEETIARFETEPPNDTRAWTRAMLLRWAGENGVEQVDWHWIRLATEGDDGWPVYRTLELGDPLDHTRERAAEAFEEAGSLGELVDALEGRPRETPETADSAAAEEPTTLQ